MIRKASVLRLPVASTVPASNRRLSDVLTLQANRVRPDVPDPCPAVMPRKVAPSVAWLLGDAYIPRDRGLAPCRRSHLNADVPEGVRHTRPQVSR
jgi:hypothetical protein